jgi:hypothetical protein
MHRAWGRSHVKIRNLRFEEQTQKEKEHFVWTRRRTSPGQPPSPLPTTATWYLYLPFAIHKYSGVTTSLATVSHPQ